MKSKLFFSLVAIILLTGLIAGSTLAGVPNEDPFGVALYDQQNGKFYIKNDTDPGPADLTFLLGPSGNDWLPVAGDWNKNNLHGVALYDQQDGRFYIKDNTTPGSADRTFRYGPRGNTWLPVAGDWTGDGEYGVALYDQQDGRFYIKDNTTPGSADRTFRYGPRGNDWIPVAGDWNGDGEYGVALYDQQGGKFYVKDNTTPGPADRTFRYGPRNNDWLPIAGPWIEKVITDLSGFDLATPGPQIAGVAFNLAITNAADLDGDALNGDIAVTVVSDDEGTIFSDDVNFVAGAATVNITLNNVTTHVLTISVTGVTDPETVSVAVAAPDLSGFDLDFRQYSPFDRFTAGVHFFYNIENAMDTDGNLLNGDYNLTIISDNEKDFDNGTITPTRPREFKDGYRRGYFTLEGVGSRNLTFTIETIEGESAGTISKSVTEEITLEAPEGPILYLSNNPAESGTIMINSSIYEDYVLLYLAWNGEFVLDEDVTLEAIPADDYKFKEWRAEIRDPDGSISDGGVVGTETVLEVTMNEYKRRIAVFELDSVSIDSIRASSDNDWKKALAEEEEF